MEQGEDELTTRVRGLMVSVQGPQVRIHIHTPSEDEAVELAEVLVRHFKEYGAATIEVVEKAATLQ